MSSPGASARVTVTVTVTLGCVHGRSAEKWRDRVKFVFSRDLPMCTHVCERRMQTTAPLWLVHNTRPRAVVMVVATEAGRKGEK